MYLVYVVEHGVKKYLALTEDGKIWWTDSRKLAYRIRREDSAEQLAKNYGGVYEKE